MLHIHIGPSPLALGLLVPATLAAGFDVAVVGRPGCVIPSEYGHSGSGPRGRLRYLQVDWFIGPETLKELPAELLSQIRSEEPMLMTCTLRGEIAARRSFVEELLQERPRDAETLLLACENAPDAAYDEITAGCPSGVRVLRTVVNRMCIGLDPDSEGRRMVSAHPFGEWLIEKPTEPSVVLDALKAAPEVDVVGDVEARHDRKLWMVNGAHQALALIAWAGGARALQGLHEDKEGNPEFKTRDDLRAAAQDLSVSARLSHLHMAMDAALGSTHPHLEDNLDYGVKHVLAYAEHPDNITRVLGGFQRRKLASFIATLEVRLAQPARICHGLGLSVAPFEFVFDIFEDMVENLDAFLDAEDIRRNPSSFDRRADEAAVQAYAQLVQGWSSKEQVEARIARFAEALVASCP